MVTTGGSDTAGCGAGTIPQVLRRRLVRFAGTFAGTLALFPFVLPAWGAGTLPGSFSARFYLEASGATVGRSDWSLAPAGDRRYVYESRSEAIGLVALFRSGKVTERSEWTYYDGHELRPLAYRYRRTGGRHDKDVRIRFDWEKGIAYNTARGQTWPMPVPDGTLDKMTYLLALMQDLAGGKRDVSYRIADGGKLKRYHLRVVGEEDLDTALGRLHTLKVTRVRDDDERETFIWCAPELGYLPVRVEHHERDGLDVSLVIDSVQGLGAGIRSRRDHPEQARSALNK